MIKKTLWIVLLTAGILAGTFAAVFADQNGRACWCNSDNYGCWVTAEDGGKSYIMFWSEEARQYVMGPLSAPYTLVVSHPGFSARLSLECGIAATATPELADPQKSDKCSEYKKCKAECGSVDSCQNPLLTCITACALCEQNKPDGC